jgi:CRISPR type IV-associated protein Csf1
MPTTLIYEAWKNTPKPIIYDTNDGKDDVQKEIHLKDPRTHEKYDPEISGECVICGKEFAGGFQAKHLLGDTFNDWDICKAPLSRSMCEACAFTLLLNMDYNRCKLNTYSFVASDALTICNRQQIRDFLIYPPGPPFVFVITISQKKHLAIKSKVAYDSEYFPVQWEEETVYCEREKIKDHVLFAEALRGIGFTKDEILTGRFNSAKLSKISAEALLRIEEEISKRNKQRMYALAVYAAQAQEEEEAICYLDLQLKTNLRPQPLKSSMPSTGAGTKGGGRRDQKCGRKSKDSPAHQQNELIQLEIF